MEKENLVEKIKNNFVISGDKMVQITNDNGYVPSFIYVVTLLVLSFPIALIVAVLGKGDILEGFVSALIQTLIFIPVLYIYIVICYLFLKLVGGKADFLKTVQLSIYGNTPSLLFGSIPCVNFLVDLVSLSNQVLGAQKVHEISLLRTILALVILPILVVLIVLVILSVFVGTIIGNLVNL